MHSLAAHDLSYLVFDRLADQPRLRHGVSLRRQSNSADKALTLDFNFASGDPARLRTNLDGFCRALGLSDVDPIVASQVHGNAVTVIDQPGQTIPPADALCTALPNIPLVLRGADCPLMILYDPGVPALGLAHAGWRGTVQKITIRLIETMIKQFACQPARMIAGIGPAICRHCYQVGPDVIDAVRQNLPDSEKLFSPDLDTNGVPIPEKWQLDLFEANRRQLLHAGLLDSNIEISPWCTFENPEKFYSYRREGPAAGRWALMAALK
jgi:polyphenol oxidase